MNLNTIREVIKSKCNIPSKFIYKGTRNQIEEFNGKIIKCYSEVFIVEDDNSIIRSFSYSDYAIKVLKIIL